MMRAQSLLTGLLALPAALVSAALAMAEPPQATGGTLGASSGASAAQDPSPIVTSPEARTQPPAPVRKPPNAAAKAIPQKQQAPVARVAPATVAAKPSVVTGSIVDRVPLPLTGMTTLHIEVMPLQGDADKCGIEAAALQTAAVYPLAASARLKTGRATLTHMHVRMSAVYVRRLEHCILHADVRVSSLQQVELQHSRVAVPAYVPLWEKTDIRLVPRAQAQRLAQERLKQISEQFLIDWSAQN
jgi:hypothetical protein